MIRPQWLEAAVDGPACGPDLEYDQDYLDLAVAVRGEPERQYGDTVIAAKEPVWSEIQARAAALLDRSRDLRIVHILTRAMTRREGLAGLRDGLTLARSLLETYWDSVYPLLEVDGESDPLYRANALGQFADSDGLVADLRAAAILGTPPAVIAVRDLLRTQEAGVDPATLAYSREQIAAAVREVLARDPAALAEAGECVEQLDRARDILAAHLPPGEGPSFMGLRSLLKSVGDFIGNIRAELVGSAAPSSDGAAAPAGDALAGGAVAVGVIRSRDDAVRVLDQVCAFLARNEPTNPAPLFIRRAQRLMTMPFLDIIHELAPDAAGQIENITGARQA